MSSCACYNEQTKGGKNMLYRRVKGIRSDMDHTQKEFADILGISLRSYRNKENGEIGFTQLEMIKIMLYAQISFEEAGKLFFSKYSNEELYRKNNLDNFVKEALQSKKVKY